MKPWIKRSLKVLLSFITGIPLGFLFGYFVLFADLKTPPGSADGQGGLAEFLRFFYSLITAIVTAIVAGALIFWRSRRH